jgi:hypothetical protein
MSQDFGPKMTGKLTVFTRRLQHSMDENFSGETPVRILSFLRSFMEAADRNRISEGAAARLIPYFLTGIAKEGYRTQCLWGRSLPAYDPVPPGHVCP